MGQVATAMIAAQSRTLRKPHRMAIDNPAINAPAIQRVPVLKSTHAADSLWLHGSMSDPGSSARGCLTHYGTRAYASATSMKPATTPSQTGGKFRNLR